MTGEAFVCLKDTNYSVSKVVTAVSRLFFFFFGVKNFKGHFFRSKVKRRVVLESKLFLSCQMARNCFHVHVTAVLRESFTTW